jgi:hypothetical protein
MAVNLKKQIGYSSNHFGSLLEPSQTSTMAMSSITPSLTSQLDLALLYKESHACLTVRIVNPVRWFMISSCSMYRKVGAVESNRNVSLCVISYSLMKGTELRPMADEIADRTRHVELWVTQMSYIFIKHTFKRYLQRDIRILKWLSNNMIRSPGKLRYKFQDRV